MKHDDFKELCLSIKNDISFNDFRTLSSSYNYTDHYLDSIWEIYSSKPLEFVLYHDLGKEIYNYIKCQKEITGLNYLP